MFARSLVGVGALLLVAIAGCWSDGSPGYRACTTSNQCAYSSETCYPIGSGAGLCTEYCRTDYDCASRNGFSGACTTSAADPSGTPICYQRCNRDSNCQANNMCLSGYCVPNATGAPTTYLYPYEVCTASNQCDPAYGTQCAFTDAQHSVCSLGCTSDLQCPARGSVPGVCRSLAAFPSSSAICLLSCAGGTACPAGTTCAGNDVCMPY